MDSGELAQDLCFRTPPCLSLCRCLNLLHSSHLHDDRNNYTRAASQLPADRLLVLSITNQQKWYNCMQLPRCICQLYCPTCKVARWPGLLFAQKKS